MSRSSIGLPDTIKQYLVDAGVRDQPALAWLRTETRKLPMGGMQISPEQGQLMQVLVRALGAQRCLEVGTFTGYSALAVALALPAGGRVVALDINAEWTAIGKRAWAMAGVADKIDLRLAPARESLATMIAAKEGPFDFAFIDADKPAYDAYYEAALTLLRPGGMIAIDNVLWSGKVTDPAANDPDTAALKALNLKIRDDARVTSAIVPIGDGLTLATKL